VKRGSGSRRSRGLAVALLACLALAASSGTAAAATPGIDPSYGEAGVVRPDRQVPAGLYPGGGEAVVAGPGGSAFLPSTLSSCPHIWESPSCGIPLTVRRLTPSGSLDGAYGEGGVLTLIPAGTTELIPSTGFAVDSRGRLLVAEDQKGAVQVRAFTATGQLDAGFGNGGVAPLSGVDGTEDVEGILVAPGGKLIVTLAKRVGSTARVTLVRLLADGRIDRTYGKGGKATIDISSQFGVKAYLTTKGATLLRAQECCSGASFTPVNRVSAKGKVDVSFNRMERKAQVIALGALAEPTVESVIPRPDGSIDLVGTSKAEPGSGPSYVLRLTADGRADTKFGTGGVVTLARGLTSAIAGSGGSTMAMFTVFPPGEGQPQTHVERLLSDGTADPRFGGDAGVQLPTGSRDGAFLGSTGGSALVSYFVPAECGASCTPGQSQMVLSKLIEPSGTAGSGKGGSR
jgi:uncharacterized delta-60 repeat protein